MCCGVAVAQTEEETLRSILRPSAQASIMLGVPDCTTAAGLAATLGDTSVKLNSGVSKRAETTGFGSAHAGGAHFLFADGSVRFLSDSIDIRTYRDLSTIDDGREIGNFGRFELDRIPQAGPAAQPLPIRNGKEVWGTTPLYDDLQRDVKDNAAEITD